MKAEESATAPDGEKGTSRKRRTALRRFIKVSAAIVLFGLLAKAAFEVWRRVVTPADAPRIAMSLDDTWLVEIGVMRATYEQALARAGGELFPLSTEDVGETPITLERIRELLAGMDGLLLTGGGDVDPELYGGDPKDATGVSRVRDDLETALIREARRRRMPILGICRGCQILNVAHGGTLRNLRLDEELKTAHFNFGGHAVTLEAGSALERILDSTRLDRVESFHGQAVGTLGQGVRVVARSSDGVIEAIEIGDPAVEWIVAVQWHPELTVIDEKQQALLRAFVEAARRGRD